MPFVVGIYEMQDGRMDAELARLFEDISRRLRQVLAAAAAVHRVIPMARESTTTWKCGPSRAPRRWSNRPSPGACDCICRKQKALIGALRAPAGRVHDAEPDRPVPLTNDGGCAL